MRRGCPSVRSLRQDTVSPDGEATDLAWIVDVANEGELCEALQAARRRTCAKGRVIVEGTECACRDGLATIRDRAASAGLDVVSFDHMAGRLVLRPSDNPRPAR